MDPYPVYIPVKTKERLLRLRAAALRVRQQAWIPFDGNKERYHVKYTVVTAKPFRGYANHDMPQTIYVERLPDDVRIRTQEVLP